MGFLFEFPKTAAKLKRATDTDDAPTQVPMGRATPGVRRNPDRDQHKVRVQQQRRHPKTAQDVPWEELEEDYYLYRVGGRTLTVKRAAANWWLWTISNPVDIENSGRASSEAEAMKAGLAALPGPHHLGASKTAEDTGPLCPTCGAPNSPVDGQEGVMGCPNCGMERSAAREDHVEGPDGRCVKCGGQWPCHVAKEDKRMEDWDESIFGPKTGAGSTRFCAICGEGVRDDAGRLVHVGGNQDHEPEEAIQGYVGGEWGVRRPTSLRRRAISDSTLQAIQDRDPDGRPQQPTDADYRNFENWVRTTYGADAWQAYKGWGQSEDALYDPGADDPRNDGGWGNTYDDSGWSDATPGL